MGRSCGHESGSYSDGRCSGCHREGRLRRWLRVKDEVHAAYGRECACCGESWPHFLHLDHVDGGGVGHRRYDLRGGNSNAVYRLVRRLGFPPEFQLLCANCNMAKRAGRDCPADHNQEVRDHGSPNRTRGLA